jgi:nucleoside-diphosphate-sugar epimerase
MVVISGYSGFLGKQFLNCLPNIYSIYRLGRSADADWKFDLTSNLNQIPRKSETDPEIELFIHAAGLAHTVPKTHEEKQRFFEVNVRGTERLLKALEEAGWKPKKFLFISTIAVYGEPFDEARCVTPYPSEKEAQALELTPYGRSKWEAEQIVQRYCEKWICECIVWRLPLIVGENAPGNLGAMEKAIRKGYYFRIGNSYERFRYYVNIEELGQKVLELLEESSSGFSGSQTLNVFSGRKSYGEFEDELAVKYGRKIKSLPLWLVRMVAKVGDWIPGFPLNSYRLGKLIKS